jgi:hypothetical protein
MRFCQNCGEKILSDNWDYCHKCGAEVLRPSRAFIYEQLFDLMKLQDNRRQHTDSKAHTYIGLLSIAVTIVVALGGVAIKNIMNPELLRSNSGLILLVLYLSTVLLFIISVLFAFRAYHIGSPRIKIDDKYLFSWDNVPGDDSERLLGFLRDDLNIDWAENAKILKFNEDKAIRIFTDGNSAIIKAVSQFKISAKKSSNRGLYQKISILFRKISNYGASLIVIGKHEEKATLEISGGSTYDLKVKSENGKLNIYDNNKIAKKVYTRLNENWLVQNSEERLAFLQKNMIPFLGKIISNNQRYNTQKSNNLTYAYYITITAIFSLLFLCAAIISSIYMLYK